ncbi:MAG: WYL domain-containing transcriptional regulator [Verrucomicrobiota bacterium]
MSVSEGLEKSDGTGGDGLPLDRLRGIGNHFMMPKKKTRAEGTRRPLERVLRIHEQVSRGDFPNANRLAEELEVSRKTVLRDLAFMRDELDLPLVYDERKHGHHYSRPVQDFPFLETTADDLVGLILARNALLPMRGSAMEATLRDSFRRLQANLSDRVTIPWSEIDEAFSAKSMGITEQDLFVFERLAKAVLESRELRFGYQKLRDTAVSERRLQPYHLVEIDGGWYVIGHDLDREARRTFAVQRMTSVQLTKKKFVRAADFKLEDHFAGSFGIWAGDRDQGNHFEVCIRFTDFAARVVAERRWHPSQEITMVEADGSVIEMTLQLSALEDIARWILGFGSQAEVVGPPELRERLAGELAGALQFYRKHGEK